MLDVVRAADPQQVQEAQARLKANRAAFRATSLADAGAGFSASLDQVRNPSFDAGLGNVSRTRINPADVPKPYREYEAVFLQNFVKSMLPDSEDVYGKGVAGDMWKSMAGEQIGEVLAQGRGVGIAEQMFAQSIARQQAHGGLQATTDENDRQAALSAVRDLERRTFGVSHDDSDKSSRA
ncbi:Rod binding domain-containing protein [Gellertiella hungarica]|uniref:Rod binding domain-containing protein n=1 Tax=Gellertiella hungarica TaxID=1572859 RepID=A0A7W6NJU6_9HYPH|nr:Rod binding domain-containing protein [Gellertiella hungarica]